MRVLLTGGVFGSAMGGYAASAPENVLVRFLREAGHEVATGSASAPAPPGHFDAAHAHHFGPAAYHLALSGRRPFVFTSHNPFLVSDVESDESRLEHMLQRRVLASADAVVALSNREADLLAARFDLSRERFRVIPNGLPLDLYEPSPPRLGDGLELLAVGQLVPYKGHRYLFEALATLAPRVPGLRLRVVSHQQELRAEYERLCGELGIAGLVRFEGPYSTEELVRCYRECDVLVQPSLAECFPVTILEAMACGRPVIATDVGGVAEEVGDAGLVVRPGDAAAFAGAIERLASSPEERIARGEAARARVRERYDGRGVAAAHAALYGALGPGRSPRPVSDRAARLAVAGYLRRGLVARLLPTRARRRGVG